MWWLQPTAGVSTPLTQLVTTATRGTATLDKIFTNLKSWFQTPVVLPAVGSSDHDTVLLQPAAATSRPPRQKCISYTRSSDPTGKAMIYYYLKHFNWSSLYCMDSCETMVQYFYSVILSLLGSYLPFVRRNTLDCDKPWVTHSWWTKTKRFLYSSTSNPLEALKDGQSDVAIADVINDFLPVSRRVSPRWTSVSSPISLTITLTTLSSTLLKSTNVSLLLKYTSLLVPMASRIGFFATSVHSYVSHLQPFIIRLLDKDLFPGFGSLPR